MRFLSLLLLLSLCFSCSEPSEPAQRAFYYWRSRLHWQAEDTRYFAAEKIPRLYVRFFDVGWQQTEAMPIAPVEWSDSLPNNLDVVPVVFITNETMTRLKDSLVNDLGQKIATKIKNMAARNGLDSLREVQIDCDWNGSTKDKYFNLLKKIKAEIPAVQLSATIRLHQVKFFKKTGIPPVDKGLLMCYNMGTPKKFETTNSVLDLDIVKSYTKSLENYPLKLDVALPLFSWGVVFRNKKFVVLLNNLRHKDMAGNEGIQHMATNYYTITEEMQLMGTELYPGDVVRVEEVSPELCRETAEQIKKNLKQNAGYISLFHYDPKVTENYAKEDIQSIYRIFE